MPKRIQETYMLNLLNLLIVIFICGNISILTADLKLAYKEIKQFTSENNEAGLVIQLIPEGFPERTPLLLSMERVDGAIIDFEDEIILDSDTNTESLKFGLQSFAKGEPVIYTLQKLDGSSASVKIIPFPIMAKDTKGHRLSVEMAAPDGKVFLVRLEGFDSNEIVELNSDIFGEKIKKTIQVNSEGSFQFLISPIIKGQVTGDASLSLKAHHDVFLKVNYLWGSTAKLPYKTKTPCDILSNSSEKDDTFP